MAVNFKRPYGLLQRFLKCSADGHRFTDRLHLNSQLRICSGELLKGETRPFNNAIVNGRFKTGRRLLGNIIWNFIKGITDSKQRSDFSDRKAGGLGSKR